MNAPSKATRELVCERDRQCCVACGRYVGDGFTWWSLQHRVARGVGGGNGPENLLVLCGSATSRGCHRTAEDRDAVSHARGYWLRSDEDPALVPVEHVLHGRVWLLGDGTVSREMPAAVAS